MSDGVLYLDVLLVSALFIGNECLNLRHCITIHQVAVIIHCIAQNSNQRV